MNDYLLLDGTQIPVSAELAQVVGLNEAIVLQEVYYWCKVNKRERRKPHDGYYWVYNSYEDWQAKHFPWWSVDTVKRTFKKLKDRGLIVTGNYNEHKFDKTIWYRIDFECLQMTIKSSPLGQNALMDNVGITQPIPDIIPESNVYNGVFPSQALKNARVDFGDNEFGVDAETIIDIYFREYKRCRHREHPNIKPEQRQRVSDILTDFIEQHPDINAVGFCDMIENYFMGVKNTDYNINHFATPGILENRYLEVYRG